MAIMITDECINCGACEPVCPVEAIYYEDDVPEQWAAYTKANVDFFDELGSPYRINAPNAWASTKSRSALPCAPSIAAWTTPTTAKHASGCWKRKNGCISSRKRGAEPITSS